MLSIALGILDFSVMSRAISLLATHLRTTSLLFTCTSLLSTPTPLLAALLVTVLLDRPALTDVVTSLLFALCSLFATSLLSTPTPLLAALHFPVRALLHEQAMSTAYSVMSRATSLIFTCTSQLSTPTVYWLLAALKTAPAST